MITIDALNASKFDRNYLYELQKGGATAVHVSIDMWANARDTLSNISQWYVFINENKDFLTLIRTGEDIERAKEEGKIGIIIGIQNTSLIEDELALVETFNNLGLKIMQLTYNNQNLIGSGCYEENDNGISRFGKNVIKEMNRVGIIIDLSHCGVKTTIDAIEISSRPVAITHANPHWIYPKKRNKSKEVLKKLKENNGMLGLTLFPTMMGGSDTKIEEFADLVTETMDFLGEDKVGFGSDLIGNRDDAFMHWVRMGRWTHEMDYGSGTKDSPTRPDWPTWFQGPADYQNLADGLAKRGMSEKAIRGFMGENWLNFFKDGFQADHRNM